MNEWHAPMVDEAPMTGSAGSPRPEHQRLPRRRQSRQATQSRGGHRDLWRTALSVVSRSVRSLAAVRAWLSHRLYPGSDQCSAQTPPGVEPSELPAARADSAPPLPPPSRQHPARARARVPPRSSQPARDNRGCESPASQQRGGHGARVTHELSAERTIIDCDRHVVHIRDRR